MMVGDKLPACWVLVGIALMVGAAAFGQAAPRIASGVPPEPAIHGPRVVGATPGAPFLFLIPATGEGPLTYSAQNLPADLVLDAQTGIISGAVEKAGTTAVEIEVRSPRGPARRGLTIVAGEHLLALTPPMGWNSWNIWARNLTDQKVREAADGMIRSGLAAHGYQYINIDDTWEGQRGADGEIQSNEKFPDMKALADYVHAKGLKIGIYSSPGPKTCAGYEGSLGHEEQDAHAFAKWGMDYLKYDWCSYTVKSVNLDEFQNPFRIMRDALDTAGHDIVYSLSEGGAGRVWEWGARVGANLWRTTGDINDTWESMSGIGFDQNGHEAFAGPGHWNDPDMLVVGVVKWGGPGPTHLTPDEQVTHITLWSLLAAPLFIGCDLSRLDQFTLDLLTNDEVIDVDQDPLGKAASRRARQGTGAMMQSLLKGTFVEGLVKGKQPATYGEVWARPLWDGALAVGLFNCGPVAGPITASWPALGLTGPQPVRDLWQRKDLGQFDGAFTAEIPSHGAILLKIGKPMPME
jgi:alpha-galactosidase